MGDNETAVDKVEREDALSASWADGKLITDAEAPEGDTLRPAPDQGAEEPLQEDTSAARADVATDGGARDESRIVDTQIPDDHLAPAEEEVPQPPKLEDRGADLGTRPQGFADVKAAPVVDEVELSPNDVALEKARDTIRGLLKELREARAELESAHAEVNRYYNLYGSIPE